MNAFDSVKDNSDLFQLGWKKSWTSKISASTLYAYT
jgi:hypothetical protein